MNRENAPGIEDIIAERDPQWRDVQREHFEHHPAEHKKYRVYPVRAPPSRLAVRVMKNRRERET